MSFGPNDLPPVNAALNLISATLLFLARRAIKRGQERQHRKLILGALASSSVFLVCYLIFHYLGVIKPHGGGPLMKTLFFMVLGSHTVLAAFVPPLAAVTVWFALTNKRDRHKAIAPWTFAIWFYVSTTGVVIFLLKLPYY